MLKTIFKHIRERRALFRIERYLEVLWDGKHKHLPEINTHEGEVLNTAFASRRVEPLDLAARTSIRAQLESRLEQGSVPAAATAEMSNSHQRKNMSINPLSLFAPRKLWRLVFIVPLVIAMVIVTPEVKSTLHGRFERKAVSAQEIMTRVASNIMGLQNTDEIVHRKDWSRNCFAADSVSGPMPVPYTADAENPGYSCYESITESWNMGDAYYTITTYPNDPGKVDLYLSYEGVNYSYAAGARKAAKVDQNRVNEALKDSMPGWMGISAYGMGYGIGGVSSEALNSTARDSEDGILLQLKERYGDVEIHGEETVGGKEAFKLSYRIPENTEDKVTIMPVTVSLQQTVTDSVAQMVNSQSMTVGVNAELNATVSSGAALTGQGEITVTSGTLPALVPDAEADVGQIATGSISMPAPMGNYRSFFWVDKESFEQVKYEERIVLEDGSEQLIYASEVLINEVLPKSEADSVFVFRAPEGVEVVDRTEAEIAHQRKMADAQVLDIDRMLREGADTLYLPATLPADMRITSVSYTYPSSFYQMDDNDDFLPPYAMEDDWTRYYAMAEGFSVGMDVMTLEQLYPDPALSASRCYRQADYPTRTRSAYLNVLKGEAMPDPWPVEDNVGTETKTLTVAGQNVTLTRYSYPRWDGSAGEEVNYDARWQSGEMLFALNGSNLSESEMLDLIGSLRRVSTGDEQVAELQEVADYQQNAMQTAMQGPPRTDVRALIADAAVPFYTLADVPEGMQLMSLSCTDAMTSVYFSPPYWGPQPADGMWRSVSITAGTDAEMLLGGMDPAFIADLTDGQSKTTPDGVEVSYRNLSAGEDTIKWYRISYAPAPGMPAYSGGMNGEDYLVLDRGSHLVILQASGYGGDEAAMLVLAGSLLAVDADNDDLITELQKILDENLEQMNPYLR